MLSLNLTGFDTNTTNSLRQIMDYINNLEQQTIENKILSHISTSDVMKENTNNMVVGQKTLNVILNNLTQLISFKTNPSGSIILWTSNSIPNGWLLCDGSTISRTLYSKLFSILSTTFGSGDGSTTFNLPDFRGVFPKGAGTTNRVAGKDANGNYYVGTLGQYLQDKMQGHWHDLYYQNAGTGTSYLTATSPGGLNISNGGVRNPATDGTNGTPRTGGTTEPQSLGINFIIKY